MRWLIAFALSCWLTTFASADLHVKKPSELDPPLACADFLKDLGLQRPDVKFVSCQPGEFGGIDTLEAVYRVEGKDLLKVENWLVKLAHVRRLRFACCGWETSTGTFKGRDGASYEIYMAGESSTVSSRDQLTRIPFLTIRVTHYLHSL